MNPIPWDAHLSSRYGGMVNMCGIKIFHDFVWADVFHHERAQFRNGKCLAKLVRNSCPDGKQPALLLTRRKDVGQGKRNSEQYCVTIVNIDEYLKKASGDAATTYFAMLTGADVFSAASIDWSTMSNADSAALLSKHVNIELLRAWNNADRGHVNVLIQLLHECKVDPETLVRGREAEIASILPPLLGEQFWETIQQAGADLPDALAHRRLWSIRNAQVEKFKAHLEQGDWPESDWQRFFEKNIWIFGYGLTYQFLHAIEDNPSFGGKDLTGAGSQEGDYLLATSAATKFTVLVEIKRPETELVTDKKYRNRTYEFGHDLTGGVAQIQQQCWRWATEASRSDENRDLLESKGIFTHNPRGILVIGNTAKIRNNRDKMRTFESFRRNLHNPEVITFDELLYRAEKAVQAYAKDANVRQEPSKPALQPIVQTTDSG